MFHPLMSGSPAIDGVTVGDCLLSDQLGRTRPMDGDDDQQSICDIGAVERGSDMLFEDSFE